MTKLSHLALCLSLSPYLAAQDAVGSWQGTLDAGAAKLRLVLHVAKAGDKLEATLDSVDQGANGIPIQTITVKDGEVRFAIPNLRASYAGKLTADGKAIEGTFSQGAKLPLRFERVTGKIEQPARPQTPEAPFPYTVEPVKFTHGKGEAKVTLAGTLTIPKSEGPHPAAILISGSGPQDRDESLAGHKPFWVIADHLSRHGIATLRYDDRGFGESTGRFRDAVTDDFADDAEAAWHFLRERKGLAADKIGFVGHSEGGLVAPIVAARNQKIGFVIMLAGPGVPGWEILDLQNQLIARAAGASEARLQRAKQTNGALFRAVLAEPDPKKLRAKMTAILDETYEALSFLEKSQVGEKAAWQKQIIDRLTGKWMLHFLRFDPRSTLARVTCPVLALNGGRDLQVDAKQNLPPIEAALKKAGNTDVTAVTFDKLNHLFQSCETGAPTNYAKIEETFAPQALTAMSSWLRKRFLK